MDESDRSARRSEVIAGQRMSEFLHDELMVSHMEGMLHGWQNMWLDEEDEKVREQLWMKARALRDFIESLQSVVTTGEMAAFQLSEDRDHG